MLVSTVAFITECTDNCRFRHLFRLNSLFRTQHSDVVLQQCFLPLVFVPIPVYLRCFRFSPGSARKMTPGHVPWPSLRLNKRFGVACSSSRPSPVRITSGVTALDKWKADTPIHLDHSTTPDQRFLSSLIVKIQNLQSLLVCPIFF